MNQVFAEKLSDAGWDKQKLLNLLNEIDSEKRSLKIALRRVAQDPEYSMKGMGRARQNKERKIKDKQRYLIEDREVVRKRIGKINRELKSMNRALHRQPSFTAAFFAAAEEMLSEDKLKDIELRAVEVLANTK